jgi:hypothetical protein
MNLGVENKKSVYWLIGLGVVAAYMVYSQLLSGPSSTPARVAPVGDAAAVANSDKAAAPDLSRASEQTSRPAKSVSKNGEFRPVLRSKKKEDRASVTNRDPSLRLDLLAKVMKVPQAGGERDLFQILKGPPVKEVALVKGPEPKVIPFVGPHPPPPPPPPPPPEPPPPIEPIPLRYYAYSAIHPDGKRTAYFLTATQDGDEILEAKEGAVLKGRYRIVQIGLDKVVVEDMQKNRRQSIALEPEVSG